MVRTIKPIGNKVLCGQLFPTLRLRSGIHLVDRYQDDRKQFQVIAVGPKVKADVIAGDRVLVEMMGHDRFKLEDGSERWLIDAREIVAVFKHEQANQPTTPDPVRADVLPT